MSDAAGTGAAASEPGVQAQTEGATNVDATAANGATSTQATSTPATKPAEEIVYEFKAPEGVELDAELVSEFTGVAKELKLPADKAQAVVDMGLKLVAKQAEAHQAQVARWADEIKADKVLGGDKLPETLATATKVYSLLPAEEATAFKGYLDSTGLGNHPSMIRLLHAVGQSLSEDKFVPGSTKPAGKSSFYENSNMN